MAGQFGESVRRVSDAIRSVNISKWRTGQQTLAVSRPGTLLMLSNRGFCFRRIRHFMDEVNRMVDVLLVGSTAETTQVCVHDSFFIRFQLRIV